MATNLRIRYFVLMSIFAFVASCLYYYCYSYRSFREKAVLLERGKTSREEAEKIMGCPTGHYGFGSYSLSKALLRDMIDPPDQEYKIAIWSDNDCLVAVAFRGGFVAGVTIVEPNPLFFDRRPIHERFVH